MCTLIIRAPQQETVWFFPFILFLIFSPGKFENIKTGRYHVNQQMSRAYERTSRCGCCYGRRSARLPYRIGRAVSLPFLPPFFFLDFDRKTGGEKEEEYTIVVATSFFSRRERVCYTFLFFGAPGADAALFSLLNTPSRCRLFYFFGLVIRCKESRPFDFSSHAQLFFYLI